MGSRYDHFPKYDDFDPLVPVWCVTPRRGRIIHRFFDTSPFSPSGRYLGLTRLPFENRLPTPGDVAEIVLIDLETGEERVLTKTHGWGTQLGAQVQWGRDDTQLYFNDVDVNSWRAFGVKLNPFSGERKCLDGTVYMVSPDGNWAISPCLLRIGITQSGYGITVPAEFIPLNQGASREDGVYLTNTSTGQCNLLVSFSEILETAKPNLDKNVYKNGDFYGFHVKWNPQGDRIMLVMRWMPRHLNQLTEMHPVNEFLRRIRYPHQINKIHQRMKRNLITMKADGTDIHIAIPSSEWSKGGNHPNWCPDGETIMMNLKYHKDNAMRFVKFRYDGSHSGLISEELRGSGHPSMHKNSRYIVTDAYPWETLSFKDGTVPIRFLDLNTHREETLLRIKVAPRFRSPKNELRIDPHPAWDTSFRYIAINASPNTTRRVYVADLKTLL
ncbi:MAG: hypothetical protein JSV20_10505 [Candidatus Bathyarchaeota archaeon]|nr:MAG: hypothetical protein JSV20_10505 [Candidatus Bathyarchaeota archaeon]